MSWTDERVELLKKLWLEGKSASVIAKELGDVTRNAVIGKVHRLGLSNRTTTAAPAPKAKPAAKEPPKAAPKAKAEAKPKDEPKAKPEAAAKPAAAPQPQVPSRSKAIVPAGQPLPPQPSANETSPELIAKAAEIEKKAKKLTLMELTEKTCKWPIGDPATENFWFCGHAAQAGKPYCETHNGLAFQQLNGRRDRRR